MSAHVICAIGQHDAAVEPTIRLAAGLAIREQLMLDVVAVEEPAPPPMVAGPAPTVAPGPVPIGGMVMEPERTMEAGELRHALEEAARDAGARDIVAESVTSRPREALIALSSRPDAHVLVVRDSGDGPLQSAFTGNAARQALRSVRCPLVVLPAGLEGRLPHPPRLFCAVEDDEAAVTVAAFAGTMACMLDAPLHIVHSGGSASSRPDERLEAACRQAMPEAVDATFAHLPGPPITEVPAAADRCSADVAIVGAPHHGAMLSALRGSVTHRLIDRATMPVVVVPDAVQAAGL
jgi:nucleotide-binding universal stress UspA family protein